MNRQDDTSTGLPGPADLVTAAGIDHVRLVYDYLAAGDLDSCASLLHDGVVLELPGLPPVRGRTAVLHSPFGRGPSRARYEIDRVVGQDRSVVATGRRVGPGTGGQELRFVDLFTIADDGMVLACTRYYHAAP
ncbi:nuclear transport factor 2 family protein [Streptomyces sp. NPDC053513]|uniref:Nuclear transport factor 2 family protein n=1 Tax=Streptomyces litmocidini TaxID=67318 RepID=A0ABW7U9R0_9ACTN|nr:nuclear transport factor 2 family protein [Streptomyces sp. PanSC19]